MRRVDAEGDSQGRRDRKRGVAQASRAAKPHLRRLSLEGLEGRTLLSTSTLPSAITQGQFVVGDSQSGVGNSSSPSVAIDPLNPNKLVAAWVVNDPGHPIDGNGQVTVYVEAGYSVDGGQTWHAMPGQLHNNGLIDADVQPNFSATGSPQPNFAQTTDATVAFGRDESVYLLSSSHDATGANGELNLQRWDFSSLTPSPQTIYSRPAYDNVGSVASTVNPIYRWQGVDSAITPTLAVDNNVANFDNGATTPNDPFVGNVYVAWETNDAAPSGVAQNPNTIKLMASDDQGQQFTYQAYLNNHSTGNLYDQPKIAISQGSLASGVPAGQVTIVYDNAGPGGGASPAFDVINTKASTTGGNDSHYNTAGAVPIVLATPPVAPATADNTGTTTIPISVPANSLDPNFASLQNLTFSLSLQYPTLGNTSAVLVAPDGTTVTLWTNATDVNGNATNSTTALGGANLGATTETRPGSNPVQPFFIGTTLDSTANRPLSNGAAPYTGHFRPAGSLNVFDGRTAGQLVGTWNLVITTYRTESPTTPPTPIQLIGASLDFTSGNSDITTNPANRVATTYLNSGANQYTGSGIQTGAAAAILAAPSIASDNTLGANSPFQGRLYIAFTNDDFTSGGGYTNATFIQLYYSDNGGVTWSPDTTDAITGMVDGIVNNDNGLKDGFSTGGFAVPGSGLNGVGLGLNPTVYGEANVRPKLEPQVAVDPATGTVVVTYLDTRNDAAALRVATYVAVSSDGGSSFAPQTYANESNPLATLNPAYTTVSGANYGIPTITTDAITGQPVNLGPVPDNQSAGNAGSDGTFGFGQRQGLAVLNGHIIPLWASNQNGTTIYAPTPNTFGQDPSYVGAEFLSNAGSNARNQKTFLNIEAANIVFAAGPRVIASTQGPVGQPGDTVNVDRAPDGSPIADTIVLTFDRAVNPSTFPADGPASGGNPIGTSPLEVFYNNPGGGAPIPLRVLSVTADASDTIYTIKFDPAGNTVGTYTYTLRPFVQGMIPYESVVTANQTQQVQYTDTAVNGGSSLPFTVSGHAAGTLLSTATLAGQVDIYQQGTSTGSPTDLQIFLVANDGTRFLLYSGTTQGQTQGSAFSVNSSITIPSSANEPLDQTYTILLVDNVPGEQAFLFNNVNPNDFNFQVTLNNQTTMMVPGNLLDQNGNGVPGESPADNYSVPTGRNSLPLIVPGPHVVSTFVSTGAGSTVTQPLAPVDSSMNGGQATFTIPGQAGQVLTAVTLSGMLTITPPNSASNSPLDDVQIYLIGADSKQYLLFNASTAGGVSSIPVQATVTIPASAAEPLGQAYTIEVVDNVAGQAAVLSGTSGLASNFQLQLAGQDVVSTGSDNLVNNGTVSSVNVTFDRQMQVASFTQAQVLSIVGPTGRVDGPQVFTSTGTSRTFSYQGQFELIPKAGTLTSMIPISGTGLDVSNLTVQVSITDPNDGSLQLVLVAPDGTMVPLVNASTTKGANFTNTTFSDAPAANGLTVGIGSGVAPYSLTYQPASPLAAMAGRAIDGTWKLLVSDSTATGAQGRLNSWSLGITPQVPKGVGTELDSTLVVSSYPDNSFKIAHLAVQLNISSTLDSDLQVYLVSPDGTITVPLILNDGGNGSNFTNTTLDDGATIPIASGNPPFTLTYQPAAYAINPAMSLNLFDGLSIEGTWKLRIVNPNNDGSVTTLNSWSLIATPQLTITPVNPTVIPGSTTGALQATTFAVGFPTQNLSGSYNIILSPNILSVAPNPANPTQGTPLDSNLNAGVDALRGASTGVTAPVTYPATAVPVPIPYAQTTPLGTTNGVLTSQIYVPDNFAIQPDLNGGTLAGLTISLNISYYNDPDLIATLTAPDGKTIQLFMNVGKGANPANFTGTTLSDTVTPPAPISQAAAPFFGTFNPEAPSPGLAGFATDLMGNQAFSQGLWTLTITNIGQDPGINIDKQFPPSLLNWSLTFQKPQVSTGLGEPVADQATVGFRIFNFSPTNPLANDTWTAVGPAGTTSLGNALNGDLGGVNLAGPVSAVAIDPVDPSGNIAFVGASSGGLWRTTDFLTTAPQGPTYLPLTDFGANYSINIGSIAIFDRNNDPNQSIIYAGTGNAQATTANAGNSVQGVGILRSTNGGASFTLLDSSTNVDASGNPLPINSPLRDHIFVGTTTYKIIVDPNPLSGGNIIYAALGGPNGGLWRSLDGGNHWTNMSAGIVPKVNGQNAAATDVLLDPASVDASTGNLDILYAAFQGVGVFISTSQGQALTELLGNVGADNLIQNSQAIPGKPLTVADASPNGAFGRIILAKPALTGSASENILYQDWLYAAVENVNGTFNGLYVTKDRGENWTKVEIANQPTPGGAAITQALPTNDNTQKNNYDVTNPVGSNGGGGFSIQNGNAAFSMTIDPLNPNVIYLGGTQNYANSGLIRVDLTGLYDAHAYVPFASNLNGAGGTLARDAAGRVNVAGTGGADPFYQGTNPNDPSLATGQYYLNLRHSPTDPFNVSATLFVSNSSAFTNSGYGVAWQPIDQIYGDPLGGSTNIHSLTTIVDPLTGLTRLIIANDQGVFTAVYNADGTLNTSGIGTNPAITGSRNGNLQDEELYYTAAQPSALASAAAGALFYGSGIGMANVQSASNALSTGNLNWIVAGTSYGDIQNVIQTEDRGGTGIATDQTGGVTTANPGGSPTSYQYNVPFLGGDTTNFFRVQDNGSTTGLTVNYPVAWPATNILSNGNGVSQLGNFTVNPIDGNQALIGSNLGDVFETTNKGTQWLLIGSGSTTFDGTYAQALAYGAPDPGAPNGVGSLNNFIYVGTIGTESTGGNIPGHIYVTRTGAGPWTNLSAGLDGSSVVAIYTNPNRGSREAYAVTLKGVYYMADSTAPNATWVNITGNLTQIERSTFGNPALAQNALLGYNGTQLGGFRSIVADYRYFIPDPVNPSLMHPVLYVAGYGGVFRSLDNGQTWTLFPNTAIDAAPVDGGYLPSVDVTDLQLNLGPINPATGHGSQAGVQSATSTQVVPLNPTGTVTSPLSLTYAAGLEIASGTVTVSLTNTNVGNLTITLIGPGGQTFLLPTSTIVGGSLNSATFNLPAAFLAQTLSGTYTLSIADNTPGDSGQLSSFSVALTDYSDVSLLASTLGRGDFAIRLAPVVFATALHLDTTLPAPTGSNTGLALGFTNVTSVSTPYIDGLSESSSFGNTITITLIDESNGDIIGTGTTDAFGNFSIQIVNNGTDPTFFLDSLQFNDKVVGIQATDSAGDKGNIATFSYTLVANGPSQPGKPILLAAYDSGRSNSDDFTDLSIPAQPGPGGALTIVAPVFDVPILLPPVNPLITTVVELLRSTTGLPGSFTTVVDTVPGGVNPAVMTDPGLVALASVAGGINQTFYYEAIQVDQANNVSTPVAADILAVTVDTVIPPALAAPTLDPSTNSGPASPPYTTSFTNPTFDVTGLLPNEQVYLYRSVVGSSAPAVQVGIAPVGATTVTDSTVGLLDNAYLYYVSQQDQAGNFSPLSPGVQVSINTQVPPIAVKLEPAYDTGRSSTDLVTNIEIPAPTPGSTPSFVAPVFDVTTTPPPSDQPPIVSIELLRSTSPTGPFAVVATAPVTPNLTSLSDTNLLALVQAGPVNQDFYYEAIEINSAMIPSNPSAVYGPVLVDTVIPPALPAPTLDPSTNTGTATTSPYITSSTSPLFDATNLLPNEQLFLFRSVKGSAAPAVQVGVAALGVSQVSDQTVNLPDNVYLYYVAQQDQAGNFSPLSPSVQVTINTQAPPTKVVLEGPFDTGRSNSDNITNIEIPAPTPGSTPVFVNPIYDVTTVTPASFEPVVAQVELLRAPGDANGPTGAFTAVNTVAATPNLTKVTDPTLASLAAPPVDTYYYYEAIAIDAVGISSVPSSPALRVELLTVVPPALPAPTLDPGSNSGLVPSLNITNVTHPTFDVPAFNGTSGLLPGDTLELYRSVPRTSPTQYILVGSNPTPGATTVTDTSAGGAQPDGVYLYRVVQVDIAGNVSPFNPTSPDVTVTINTTTPPQPTINLIPSDDSGLPSHPNVTNVNTPHFTGTAQYNASPVNFPVDILSGEAGFSQAPAVLPSGVSTTYPQGVLISSSTPLTVPAGQQVVAGYVTLTISNKSQAGGLNLGNLAVEIIRPDGQGYFILAPSLSFTATSLTSANFSLPASFLTGVLSGTWLLGVADLTTGDVGSLTSWSITLLNGTDGVPTVLASTGSSPINPAPTNTYALQITNPLADGNYILVARSRNVAGTPSYSAPLPITIKHQGPLIVPTLSLLPADDTGIKGDGVTANHRPHFIGTADPGALVNIYAVINGQVVGPEISTTASTINGSFSIQLPFNLTDGFTTLYAQAVDVANNKGPFSAPFNVRITTVAGDYLGVGAAQLSVFDPNTETYYVLAGNSVIAEPAAPGSSYSYIPVQYDFNGDGITDNVAYNFAASSYVGNVSPATFLNLQYGGGYNLSLPASGPYGPGGSFLFGNFGPSQAFYAVSYPTLFAQQFVVPNLDIPTPAAYDGNGVAEVSVFRPSSVAGPIGSIYSDADSFSVLGPQGFYQVSFTNPNATFTANARAAGYTYQAGDIPAPADYDGVGRDEFAIYRPGSGQFFILNTHGQDYNAAAWTVRTVTMNLPGGPSLNDVPASQDYDGNGKVDPTVFRPSNATFYMLHSSTGIQQTIPFGLGNFHIAAAGPLLYRLTALDKPGQPAVTDGYTPGVGGLPQTASRAPNGLITGESIATPAISPATIGPVSIPNVVALALPANLNSQAITASAATSTSSSSSLTPATVVVSPAAASAPSSKIAVTIGAATPMLVVPTVNAGAFKPTVVVSASSARAAKAKKPVKPLAVDTKVEARVEARPQVSHPKPRPVPAKSHAVILKHVVSARKGAAKKG